MSTLASTIKDDVKIFNFLYSKAYPNRRDRKKLQALVWDGVITVETLLEKALAIQGGLIRDSIHGRDFTDGSDAKKATASIGRDSGRRKRVDGTISYNPRNRYTATVGHIETKNGALRVLVYEPKFDKFHFFLIPAGLYDDVKTLKFEFNIESGKLVDSCRWSPYKVGSFKDLSRKISVARSRRKSYNAKQKEK